MILLRFRVIKCNVWLAGGCDESKFDDRLVLVLHRLFFMPFFAAVMRKRNAVL